MSLRTRMLLAADRLRSRLPAKLGTRHTTVVLRRVVWSGGARDEGTPIVTDTAIVPTPRVMELESENVQGSGGMFGTQIVELRSITPRFTEGDVTGGYTEAMLAPHATQGTDYYYVLTGQVSGEFSIKAIHSGKLTEMVVQLERRITVP